MDDDLFVRLEKLPPTYPSIPAGGRGAAISVHSGGAVARTKPFLSFELGIAERPNLPSPDRAPRRRRSLRPNMGVEGLTKGDRELWIPAFLDTGDDAQHGRSERVRSAVAVNQPLDVVGLGHVSDSDFYQVTNRSLLSAQGSHQYPQLNICAQWASCPNNDRPTRRQSCTRKRHGGLGRHCSDSCELSMFDVDLTQP